jgi:hypothetical protein
MTSRGRRHRGGRPGRPPGSRRRQGSGSCASGVGTAARAVPWSRGPSSSSRRSSAMFIEVLVGSRVAGPDRYVGGLLDQAQLRFAGHGRLRLPGAGRRHRAAVELCVQPPEPSDRGRASGTNRLADSPPCQEFRPWRKGLRSTGPPVDVCARQRKHAREVPTCVDRPPSCRPACLSD